MSLAIRKSQVLNDGTVQVEIQQSKKQNPFYFRVKKENVDSFISETMKLNSKVDTVRMVAIFSSILAGTFGISFFTKNMANNFQKFLANTAAGVGAAMIADSLCGTYFESKQKEINRKNEVYLV